jgi:hypothetical protein
LRPLQHRLRPYREDRDAILLRQLVPGGAIASPRQSNCMSDAMSTNSCAARDRAHPRGNVPEAYRTWNTPQSWSIASIGRAPPEPPPHTEARRQLPRSRATRLPSTRRPPWCRFGRYHCPKDQTKASLKLEGKKSLRKGH